jgi:hypothetical protein
VYIRIKYGDLADYAVAQCRKNLVNVLYDLPPPWSEIRRQLDASAKRQASLLEELVALGLNPTNPGGIYSLCMSSSRDGYYTVDSVCREQVEPKFAGVRA